MLWPDRIFLEDLGDLALEDVLADVTIHHGRTDVADDPTATTCQIVLRDVAYSFVRAFDVGQRLDVSARDGAAPPIRRFTGRVTDARLDVDELVVIATGKLSTLGRYRLGGSGVWPEESWSARVTRAFTEAGIAAELELYVDPDFDPLLAARDSATAGETNLRDYLAFLAPMVGAAVTDRVDDGRILVQALGARSLDNATPLDPADVLYAPAWEKVLPSSNVVTVRYTGDQSESVTVADELSVEMYGELPSTLDTTFVNAADATTRANQRLARSAFPHWNISEAPLIRALELSIGQPVTLSQMPPSSPSDPWTPIVEGWTDTITRDDWTMTLALSDPLESGLGLLWEDVPAPDLWNTIAASVAWSQALTLEDLHA